MAGQAEWEVDYTMRDTGKKET